MSVYNKLEGVRIYLNHVTDFRPKSGTHIALPWCLLCSSLEVWTSIPTI
jgi:hypothetical protein